MADGAPVPLTKTKLFTLSDEGSWTEIGVGVAAIRYESAASCDDGSTVELAPKLVIESLDDETSEILLSTPLSTDDIYQVQKGTILVWTDPELARDMAASFHTADGCQSIMDEILRFQRDHSKNHDLLGEASDKSSEDVSPWAATKRNLPGLIAAVLSNKQRFAMYFKANGKFYGDLVRLFTVARAEGDLATQSQIGEIVYTLLSRPFSTDNKILGPMVDEEIIESTVDIVQVYLGRVDAGTGFLSPAERRAKFRDSGLFSPLMLKRCHFVAEIQTLRDLLPLQLEDGDAGTMGILAMYCLRLKYELLCDVCSPDVIGKIAVDPESDGFEAALLDIVPLLHDLCTTIKVSSLPLEPKELLLRDAVSNGILKIAASAFRFYVKLDAAGVQVAHQQHSLYILGRFADILGSCAAFAPTATREAVLLDATLDSIEGRSLMELLIAAMSSIEDDVAQQSFFDAFQLITVGLQATAMLPMSLIAQRTKLGLIRFVVTGAAVDPKVATPSPLRHLISGLHGSSPKVFMHCAKVLVFVFQRLMTLDRIFRPEQDDWLSRVAAILPPSVCAAVLAVLQSDCGLATKAAALQLIASVFMPPFNEFVACFTNSSAMPQLAQLIHEHLCLGRRRQNILFGAVSSVMSNLCASLHQEPEVEAALAASTDPLEAQIENISKTLQPGSLSWEAEVSHVVAIATIKSRRALCARIARMIMSVDAERLQRLNPLAFAALDAVAASVLPDAESTLREASVHSVAVGATGSRNGNSSPVGDVSPDHNPFLPRRSRSQPGSDAGLSARSVDDEFQALMADFESSGPSRLDLDPDTPADVSEQSATNDVDALEELPLKRTRSEQIS